MIPSDTSSDVEIAQAIAEKNGHTMAERQAVNRRLQFLCGGFMTGIDIEEGRCEASLFTGLLPVMIGLVFPIIKLRSRFLDIGADRHLDCTFREPRLEGLFAAKRMD